ncbi:MAG TPA: hypothetical protein VII32_01515 [Thermoanaerobaculia bacterium]
MRLRALPLLFICATALAQRIPLTDLGTGTYLGQFQGGLYENGANVPPSDHAGAGLAQAALITPLDRNGTRSPSGKIVMISIGMSNATQEFCAGGNPAPCSSWSFVGQAARDPAVNHSTLMLINGARGGQVAETWDAPTDANYDLVRDTDLVPAGVTEAQVQVAWLKEANPGPTVSLPAQNADAYRLVTQLGNVVRAMKVRYPNLHIVYLASRIYAGYATSTLNPEPYAYETGFAVKLLVQAQIEQMRSGRVDARGGDLNYNSVAPWIAWGPYFWADGMNPRADGLTWARADLSSADGTHPSESGQQKVGALLLAFLKQDPTSRPWFLAAAVERRRTAHH